MGNELPSAVRATAPGAVRDTDLTVLLQTGEAERAQLLALQQAFAELCNALVPVVVKTHCWNRVGLHHLAYHDLRARFPRVGSQMICNAIYSVSRAYRLVPKRAGAPLPILHFLSSAPVFFDRHTVSVARGHLSMYTLNGRVRFGFACSDEILEIFARARLREIVLQRRNEQFSLSFRLQSETEAKPRTGELPEYVVLLPERSARPSEFPLFSEPPEARASVSTLDCP